MYFICVCRFVKCTNPLLCLGCHPHDAYSSHQPSGDTAEVSGIGQKLTTSSLFRTVLDSFSVWITMGFVWTTSTTITLETENLSQLRWMDDSDLNTSYWILCGTIVLMVTSCEAIWACLPHCIQHKYELMKPDTLTMVFFLLQNVFSWHHH